MIWLAIVIGYFVSPIFGNTTIDSVPAGLVMGAKPMWSDYTESVYFVDIIGHKICRYSPGENTVYKATIDNGNYTGYISPIDGEPNSYIVGTDNLAVKVNWDGSSPTATKGDTLFEIEPGTNFLTLFVSPNNSSMYFGGYKTTFCRDHEDLPLYYYTPSKGKSVVASNFKSITGLALDEKRNVLYVMDSCGTAASAFDYNSTDGSLSNGRVIAVFNLANGVIPIGVAIDKFGMLYTSLSGAGTVCKFDPIQGTVIEEIKIPTPYIYSLSFGGQNHTTLFVPSGTAAAHFTADTFEGTMEAPAGDLFLIHGVDEGETLRHPQM